MIGKLIAWIKRLFRCKTMEILPNIGEPLGKVVNGQLYISPVWYEALKKQAFTAPSEAQLDFVNSPSIAFNGGDSAQNNAKNAHTRISRLVTFVRAQMQSLEEIGVFPGWTGS